MYFNLQLEVFYDFLRNVALRGILFVKIPWTFRVKRLSWCFYESQYRTAMQ